MARSRLTNYRFWLRIILNAIALVILVLAFHYLNVNNLLQNIINWIKDQGIVGIVVFIAVYNLATVLFIPGAFLTLGGGALYGLFFGSIYVFIAATLGAIFAFLIGRYFARDYISHKIRDNMTFRAIDAAICKEGFKIVFLARLSPIFPFNILNYVFGITRVALRDYILGSIGMIPGTIMYVYLGSLAMDINSLNSPSNDSPKIQVMQWSLRLIGLIATIAVSIYIARIAKRSLLQITKN